MSHPATLPVESLLADCQVRRQRRSGPGGQHRNKVETGIFVVHIPTALRAEATEQRSQTRNQELAIFRLRVVLALEFRTPAGEKPSSLWMSRLDGQRLKVNQEHGDFPALLAEAIDFLAAADWEPRQAVEKLQCSSSQLLKFLKKEPRAFELLNRKRESLGMNRLR